MRNLLAYLKSGMNPVRFMAMSMIVFLAASCTVEELIPSSADANLRSPAPGPTSIAEVAISNGFDELVGALSYVDAELEAGLVDLFLNGTDQYTVFAPTDSAFFRLYTALEVDAIEDLPAPLVLDVLFYHVTEGRRGANSVVPKKNPRNIETLLGESFYVNSDLSIDAIGSTANIIGADFSASNGIVHVIDDVLLPL